MDLILEEVCISAALALVGTIAVVYAVITMLNKEAKEKGLSEKGYDFGSVVEIALTGFVTFFVLIFYELYLKGRRWI